MTGIILAGGKNSRMGMDKLLLPVRGQPMIDRILDVLREVCGRIVVVGQPRAYLQRLESVTVVEDRIRGIGPIGGFIRGLSIWNLNMVSS